MRFLDKLFMWRKNLVAPGAISYLSLGCVIVLIPLWSIPHTMAARNSLFFCSLLAVFFSGLNWNIYKGRLNLIFLLCIYLACQILFFSTDIVVAIKNFRSEWLRFILCFILGLGIALIIIDRHIKKNLFWLGILFAVPLLLHSVQIINTWITYGEFPLGYLGLFSMHGDLAYTSLTSIILLSIYLNFQADDWKEYLLIFILLAVCFISPAVAKSRGGVLFGVFAFLLIELICFVRSKMIKSIHASFLRTVSKSCILIMILFAIFILSIAGPNRWNGVIDRLNLGLISSGSSLDISCNSGVRAHDVYSDSTGQPQLNLELKQAETLNLAEGDGARIIGLISGIKLSLENPMGINQSRQAYQIALINHCGFIPKTMLSHTHSGWVNAALAIGIPGVFILLVIYFSLLRAGLKNIPNPYAFALVIWILIWVIRTLLDATLQDQALEIQAFMLALLFGLSARKYSL